MLNILKLIKSKNAKNGAWLYLLQTFNTVVPLLTLPYITRVLGASTYGIFVISLNIISYLQVTIEYGFEMSATRKVALLGNDKEQISKLHSTVLASRVFIFFVCLLLLIIYSMLTNADRIQLNCSTALCIMLIGYCFQQNWLFQGKQEMKYISIVNIVGRSISVCLIFLLVRKEQDVFLYSVLYACSPFISSIIGLIIARVKYSVRFIRVSIKDVLNELKDGFYIFTTQLSSKVFGAIGITFLGLFAASSVVGAFGAIQKIPTIIIYVWAPISQILYPIVSIKMSHSFDEGVGFVNKMRQRILPCFVILAITIAVFSKSVVYILFGEAYSSYHLWTIPLLIWMILSINNNFLGIQILLGSGHDLEYSKAFQLGVIGTITINFILTYIFGGTGAALAPLISEVVLYIALKVQIHKIEHKNVVAKSGL